MERRIIEIETEEDALAEKASTAESDAARPVSDKGKSADPVVSDAADEGKGNSDSREPEIASESTESGDDAPVILTPSQASAASTISARAAAAGYKVASDAHATAAVTDDDAAGSANASDESEKDVDYLEHLQRLKAEFENFKKRTIREKADIINFANEQLLVKLLGVMDSLQKGLAYASQNAGEDEIAKGIVKGIELVERQLMDTLGEFGAKPFDSVGEKFDPNRHAPLCMVEREDVEENTVIEEVEKGYLLKEKLLRPAKVAVSKKKEEEAT